MRDRSRCRRRLATAALAVVAATPALVAPVSASSPATSPSSEVLFADGFDGPDGLITNEYAYRHAGEPDVVVSDAWELTSGSWFRRDGAAWSGPLDAISPDPASAENTGSAVLRAHPRVEATGNTRFAADVRPVRFATQGEGKALSVWDGLHLLVRMADDQEFYAVSALRRDGVIVVKRKSRGGPSNGGRYDTLATGHLAMSLDQWHHVEVEVVNRDGAARITLWIDGVPVLEAFDAGDFGPPLAGSRFGVRGDNLEFEIDDVTISTIES